jgi:hypothetical protein
VFWEDENFGVTVIRKNQEGKHQSLRGKSDLRDLLGQGLSL